MSRIRWVERVLRVLVVVALAGLVGCKQQLFLEPADYKTALMATLPPNIETSPHEAIVPGQVSPIDGLKISTVLDPTRPPLYLTLRQAIAVALEQGNVGSQSVNNFGFKLDTAAQFNGRSVSGTDAIRAFAVDPAVSGADIERSLSKFDARWITSMSWQKVDQPVAAQFLSFQQQRDGANFSSTLAKPLPTGGIAGITLSMDYSKFATLPQNLQSGFVNPNYTPRVQFTFEQPLLQLFGVEINQISPSVPSSLLVQGLRPSGGQTTEGILVTRIRYDQSRAEFERVVNFQLVNVETAYWNLYAAYYALYAQEEGLRQSFEGYRYTESRVKIGTDPPYQLNQARAQFELFRAQVYQARGQVLESERQLRGLLGLRSDDGFRLVPVDEPNLAPFAPDFYEAANEAIAFRPELLQARQELKAQQLNLILQKNLRRPDLRSFAQYDVAGLGTRLDGSELIGPDNLIPGNALASLGNNQFNSWTLGLRLDMPLGFRDANGAVRQAQLQLARGFYLLRDAELKTLEYLVFQYRQLVQAYLVIAPYRERRKELQVYAFRFGERIRIGNYQPSEYFNYLQVQRDLADSISREFASIAQYNSALAQFEFAKGTIQRYNNVSMGEGPLPPWVQKRAKDHEAERVAALKLRERPAGEPTLAGATHQVGPAVGSPTLPPIMKMPDPLPDEMLKNGLDGAKGGDGKGDAGKGGDGKAPGMLPQPNPLPGMGAPGMGTPAPAPRPATGSGSGATPGSGTGPGAVTPPGGADYFGPAGTVATPQFRPRQPVSTGSAAPTTPPTVPPRDPREALTVPPVPPATGGIPPTLPPSGASIPPLPNPPAVYPER